MKKNISILLMCLASLLLSCSSKMEPVETESTGSRTVRFQLSTPDKDFVLTRTAAAERSWKAYGFNDQYQLEFTEEGTLAQGTTTVEMQLEQGKTYRLLFLVAENGTTLPALEKGGSYWDLGLYEPELPLQNAKAVMISKGNDQGLLALKANKSTVRIGLVPLATRVKAESNLKGMEIKSIDLKQACSATFWSLADNTSYTADGPQVGNGKIAAITKTSYTPTMEKNICYILPDLVSKNNLEVSVKVSHKGRSETVPVTVPKNMALKMGAGKTYYIRIFENPDQSLAATWALRSIHAGRESHISFDENQFLTDEYTLGTGIDGSALDLSASGHNRRSIMADMIEPADFSRSFTTGIWVKTDAEVLGTKAILSNMTKDSDAGMAITTQPNGSWQLLFKNGSHKRLEYQPTAQRQPINDNEWHFLAVSFDVKGEIRMYYDGLLVSIYTTDGIKDLSNGKGLRIGGFDSSSQNCFNGLIDEFFFTDRVMKNSEIEKLYTSLSKKKVENTELQKKVNGVKIMDFNIWHGGREFGEEVGVQRVVDVIREADPDIVGLIETYGSGEEIADALGYCLYLNCGETVEGTNLSIISRYPFEAIHDIYDSFKCSAATIRLSKSQKINFINLWLNWTPLTDQQVRVEKQPIDQIVKDEWTTRATELQDILKSAEFMQNDKETPMIICGDFNSGSHLDWTEAAKDMYYGYVFPWPTSIMMQEKGFKDSYRELYPDPVKNPCLTWSPFSKTDLQYRIDFIYYKGTSIQAVKSGMIDQHPVRFPSDHAAMATEFSLN